MAGTSAVSAGPGWTTHMDYTQPRKRTESADQEPWRPSHRTDPARRACPTACRFLARREASRCSSTTAGAVVDDEAVTMGNRWAT